MARQPPRPGGLNIRRLLVAGTVGLIVLLLFTAVAVIVEMPNPWGYWYSTVGNLVIGSTVLLVYYRPLLQ